MCLMGGFGSVVDFGLDGIGKNRVGNWGSDWDGVWGRDMVW